MWSASFNAPGNRILSGILIFDLFPVWKSNTQAFPGFLRAGIEKIKTASSAVAAFEKNWEIKNSGLLLAFAPQEIKQIKEFKHATWPLR